MTFDGPFPRLARREARLALLRACYQLRQRGDLWVFAYGSLLWRPCYAPDRRLAATLPGFARSLCVWTVEARGTPEKPGLGLGLEARRGARCKGAVHRIPRPQWGMALRALWARELWTGVYVPKWHRVATPAGPLQALTFVINPRHPQYAPGLSLQAAAGYVRHARGKLGTCLDYVRQTHESLSRAGVDDPSLAAVTALCEPAREAI